jgi:acetyl esterase/lipase
LVPDLFDLPDWIRPIAPADLPSIWIDMGERDPQRFELLELADLLDELAVPYSLARFPGEHTEAYWAAHLEEYLKWYVLGWQVQGSGPD